MDPNGVTIATAKTVIDIASILFLKIIDGIKDVPPEKKLPKSPQEVTFSHVFRDYFRNGSFRLSKK